MVVFLLDSEFTRDGKMEPPTASDGVERVSENGNAEAALPSPPTDTPEQETEGDDKGGDIEKEAEKKERLMARLEKAMLEGLKLARLEHREALNADSLEVRRCDTALQRSSMALTHSLARLPGVPRRCGVGFSRPHQQFHQQRGSQEAGIRRCLPPACPLAAIRLPFWRPAAA